MVRSSPVAGAWLIGVAAISLILLAPAGPALAATPEEAAAGASDGLYVEAGAEQVDASRVADAIDRAAEGDIELTVVVLAASGDAVAFADDVRTLIGGTVLVFTPDAYGAASSELSQSELNDALDEAAARLAGDDVAAGVAAFVDAATPSRIRWGAIITVALLAIIVIAAVGRIVERRATSSRRRTALERHWRELERRADALADPILELSTRVELDGRPEVADRYRTAASQYGEIRDALARPAMASAVASIDNGLGQLERRIADIERILASSKPATPRRRSDDSA